MKYSLINKFVIQGANCKIWNFCNIFGTKEFHVVIGDETQIGSFTEIKQGVTIGHHCRIQSRVFVSEHTNIGNWVFVGPGVLILNDKYPSTGRIFKGVKRLSPTTIGNSVAIGGGAIIGPGLIIGRKAVIGMGAVVTKNVGESEIVVGNPAKAIGHVDDSNFKKHFADYFVE
jgi:acetyltransferase-like isoleucine patch superfamily enzyme